MKYNKISLNTIKSSNILKLRDLNILYGLKNELKDTFVNAQLFRTRTEIEVSVLNDIKFPTHASKYWQAVREQNVFFQELVMLSYGYRKNIVEIKKLKRDLQNEKDDLERELLQIEIDKKIFTSKNQEKIAKDRMREIKIWSEIKKQEAKHMNKDEIANTDNHQLISYTKRWIKQTIAMGNGGGLAERQNLIGQLRSGILKCINKGILDVVLKDFSKEIKDKIKQEYNYQQ